MHIGLISDTHGLLRPTAIEALRGCRTVLHAGDVGLPTVLDGLREQLSARVIAVRGNVDTSWDAPLPQRTRITLAGRTVLVLHDLKTLELDPLAEGIDVVVCGHSHQPRIERRDAVLYVNPGSAGPRRFRLPVTVARLDIVRRRVAAEIVELPT